MFESRRLVALAAVSVAIAVGAGGPVRAWGPAGHEMVAQAAYAQLTAKQKQRFDAILKGGGGLHEQYDDKTGQSHTCGATTLNQLAVWADCVRYGGTYAYTYDNHFDDIPLCPKPKATRADYCNDMKVCATMSLPDWVAKLKAPATSDHDRAVALAMVVHIVGDLHQPLHTETNNDTGGNSVTVQVSTPAAPDKPFTTKLHKVWDGDVVKAAFPTQAEGVKAVSQAAGALMNSAQAKSADYQAWASATHAIAVDAYGKLSPPISCKAAPKGAHAIAPAYFTDFSNDVVKGQLALGAARLATVLQGAL